MGNKQFANEACARIPVQPRRKYGYFATHERRIDVQTSFALDVHSENAQNLETQCWRGFQGFDEILMRARATSRAAFVAKFRRFGCNVFFGVVGRQNGH